MRARSKSISKLSQGRRGLAALSAAGLSPATATPEQLAGLIDTYAQTHGRQTLIDVDTDRGNSTLYRSSVSGVVGLRAGLRQACADGGRSGNVYLSSVTERGVRVGYGNPVDSSIVSEFCAGYSQMAFDLGNDPIPALVIVMSEGKVARLHAYLGVAASERLASVRPDVPSSYRGLHECHTYMRDAAVFGLCETECERAGEGGKLRRTCLTRDLETGATYVDYESSSRGQDLTEHGRGKKQARRKLTSRYQMTEASATRVHDYLCSMDLYGLWPVEDCDYMFLTLCPSRDDFMAQPISSDLVNQRLKQHLTAMGEYEGETSHSLKRTGIVRSPLDDAALAKAVSLSPETIAYYRRPTSAELRQ